LCWRAAPLFPRPRRGTNMQFPALLKNPAITIPRTEKYKTWTAPFSIEQLAASRPRLLNAPSHLSIARYSLFTCSLSFHLLSPLISFQLPSSHMLPASGNYFHGAMSVYGNDLAHWSRIKRCRYIYRIQSHSGIFLFYTNWRHLACTRFASIPALFRRISDNFDCYCAYLCARLLIPLEPPGCPAKSDFQ